MALAPTNNFETSIHTKKIDIPSVDFRLHLRRRGWILSSAERLSPQITVVERENMPHRRNFEDGIFTSVHLRASLSPLGVQVHRFPEIALRGVQWQMKP